MDDREQDLRTLLQAQLAAQRENLDWHPLPERLDAFQNGELSIAETSRIRSHLTLCRECTDFVLALGELRNVEDGAVDEVPPEEMVAVWSDFRERIRSERAEPRPWSGRQLILLAAVLALAVVGLSLWSWWLYRENRELAEQTRLQDAEASRLAAELQVERRRATGLSAQAREQNRRIADLDRELASALRPRINTPVVDLAPRSFRGTGPGKPVPEIPAGSELFTLVLEPVDQRSFSTYEAEIITSGKVLWKLERLEKTEFGNFTLTLFRSDLPPGLLTIVVFGRRNEGRVEVGTYALYIPHS